MGLQIYTKIPKGINESRAFFELLGRAMTKSFFALPVSRLFRELDGVGPVDNRPSTDKLHHFVQTKKKL